MILFGFVLFWIDWFSFPGSFCISIISYFLVLFEIICLPAFLSHRFFLFSTESWNLLSYCNFKQSLFIKFPIEIIAINRTCENPCSTGTNCDTIICQQVCINSVKSAHRKVNSLCTLSMGITICKPPPDDNMCDRNGNARNPPSKTRLICAVLREGKKIGSPTTTMVVKHNDVC